MSEKEQCVEISEFKAVNLGNLAVSIGAEATCKKHKVKECVVKLGDDVIYRKENIKSKKHVVSLVHSNTRWPVDVFVEAKCYDNEDDSVSYEVDQMNVPSHFTGAG